MQKRIDELSTIDTVLTIGMIGGGLILLFIDPILGLILVGIGVLIIIIEIYKRKAWKIQQEAERRREEEWKIKQEEERRQREEAARLQRQREEEAARLQRQREEEAARLKRHKEEQKGYYNRMVTLCEKSLTIFESIPKHLNSAEEWLDQAEADFAEGAFAPFWDSIEKAANQLARFNESICQIEDNSSRYSELTGKYEGMPPSWLLAPQSVEKLSVGTATAERMKTIVRAAQRNFQFATIYEQRKTNQILVAGFGTLAEALEGMTWQITRSLGTLADSVNTSLRAINSRLDKTVAMSRQHHYEMMEQVSEVTEREREMSRQHHHEMMKQVSEVAKREREVVKKLDDIQHNIQRRK